MPAMTTANISVWRTLPTSRFLLGAPHYPEHVDESYWQRDAERMAAAGFNTTRLGEFAWHIFEPEEGRFDFDLFDRAIAVLAAAGIDTIMCTPTATPPRWLTAKYPEVLRTNAHGETMRHGTRQQADTTSPVYREHSRRITTAMAAHYRDTKGIIGWQTDNELNTSTSDAYGAAALKEFQAWLAGRYSSIDKLNFAWGGDFWATKYDSFGQVVFPVDLTPSYPSPGHVQDYHRFLAFATARFQHDQVEILRAANPNWFITHNLGNLRDIDFRGEFSADLDFLGFDFYPLLNDEFQRLGSPQLGHALHADMARGLTGNFIVPEQQSGFGSQPGFHTMTPEPGEMRRMAMSSVARGADGLMFFRWRPAHFGAEIYWMGIIDHDDVPRRRYDEAKRFATEIAAIKDKILGTHVRIDVGIAHADFDNQEAHKTYSLGLPSPEQEVLHLYRYCYENGIACGFLHPEDDLTPLKAYYVPHWVMWQDAWTAHLEAFAKAGGTVIFGARTGSRDTNNHVIRETQPGRSISALAGVTVEDFGLLAAPGASGLFNPPARGEAESARRKYHFTLGNKQVEAGHWWEQVIPANGTDVLACWSDRFLDGEAAITSRQVGAGRVIYMGTYLTRELTENFFAEVFASARIEPLLPDLPAGVEVTMRENASRHLLFIQNTNAEPVSVAGIPAGRDLLRGASVAGTLALQSYGCAVIEVGAT